MPAATPQATQNKVVELYKAGKTYSQIEKETGVKGPVIADIVKKSGVPKRKSAAAPASTPVPPPAPATPASPPATSSTSAEQALASMQPPAPPKPKKASPIYRADCCGAQFRLDADETLESVTVCPAGCGGKP